MIVIWSILCVCFIVDTYYTWKLDHDFQEWSTDINMEVFKNFKEDEKCN